MEDGGPDDGDVVEVSPGGRFKRWKTTLGVGAQKTVYKAIDSGTGQMVAWNSIHIASLPSEAQEKARREVAILESLDHPRLMDVFQSWATPTHVVFITPIVQSGDLQRFIRTHRPRLKVLKRLAIQILEGLAYLHSRTPAIIHSDIKCENILYDAVSGNLTIGDLGLATHVDSGEDVAGTPNFMAPELYDDDMAYDERVDIYAFGMTFLEMVSRMLPYSECSNTAQIFKRVTKGVLPEALDRVRVPSVKEFILRCIQRRPDGTRPSAAELLTDPFLTEVSVEDCEADLYAPTEDEVEEYTRGDDDGDGQTGGETYEVIGSDCDESVDGEEDEEPEEEPAVTATTGGASGAGAETPTTTTTVPPPGTTTKGPPPGVTPLDKDTGTTASSSTVATPTPSPAPSPNTSKQRPPRPPHSVSSTDVQADIESPVDIGGTVVSLALVVGYNGALHRTDFEFDKAREEPHVAASSLVEHLTTDAPFPIDQTVVPMLASFLSAMMHDVRVRITTPEVAKFGWQSLFLSWAEDAPSARRVPIARQDSELLLGAPPRPSPDDPLVRKLLHTRSPSGNIVVDPPVVPMSNKPPLRVPDTSDLTSDSDSSDSDEEEGRPAGVMQSLVASSVAVKLSPPQPSSIPVRTQDTAKTPLPVLSLSEPVPASAATVTTSAATVSMSANTPADARHVQLKPLVTATSSQAPGAVSTADNAPHVPVTPMSSPPAGPELPTSPSDVGRPSAPVAGSATGTTTTTATATATTVTASSSSSSSSSAVAPPPPPTSGPSLERVWSTSKETAWLATTPHNSPPAPPSAILTAPPAPNQHANPPSPALSQASTTSLKDPPPPGHMPHRRQAAAQKRGMPVRRPSTELTPTSAAAAAAMAASTTPTMGGQPPSTTPTSIAGGSSSTSLSSLAGPSHLRRRGSGDSASSGSMASATAAAAAAASAAVNNNGNGSVGLPNGAHRRRGSGDSSSGLPMPHGAGRRRRLSGDGDALELQQQPTGPSPGPRSRSSTPAASPQPMHRSVVPTFPGAGTGPVSSAQPVHAVPGGVGARRQAGVPSSMAAGAAATGTTGAVIVSIAGSGPRGIPVTPMSHPGAMTAGATPGGSGGGGGGGGGGAGGAGGGGGSGAVSVGGSSDCGEDGDAVANVKALLSKLTAQKPIPSVTPIIPSRKLPTPSGSGEVAPAATPLGVTPAAAAARGVAAGLAGGQGGHAPVMMYPGGVPGAGPGPGPAGGGQRAWPSYTGGPTGWGGHGMADPRGVGGGPGAGGGMMAPAGSGAAGGPRLVYVGNATPGPSQWKPQAGQGPSQQPAPPYRAGQS